MNLSFGGSTGKYWNAFAKNFQLGDKRMFGGELGKFTESLGQSRDYLTTQGGSTLHRQDPTFNKALKKMANIGQHWSEQVKPLWEGGLSGTGGTLHQALLPWMEDVGLKASHHLFGTAYPGYGSAGKGDGGSGGGNTAVVAADTEDPSLINQGNWQAANTIDSFLRRENMLNRGGLATDLTKTQRGRLETANLS